MSRTRPIVISRTTAVIEVLAAALAVSLARVPGAQAQSPARLPGPPASEPPASEPPAPGPPASEPPTSRATPPAPRRETPMQGRYWTSGGVVPFVYGSLAATLGVELALDPPTTPRLFATDEGGSAPRGNTVPDAAVPAIVGVGLLAVALPDTEARWYHLKGFGEAAATANFLTSLAKNVFGRHRPDFDLADPTANPASARRSFFSGHSSMTAVTTTYLALYAHGHVFPRWRGGGGVRWWEVVSYAALGAVTVGVPASRVIDRRHHLTDVITGSAVGAAAAIGFYAWQERRSRGDAAGESSVIVLPHAGGVVISARF